MPVRPGVPVLEVFRVPLLRAVLTSACLAAVVAVLPLPAARAAERAAPAAQPVAAADGEAQAAERALAVVEAAFRPTASMRRDGPPREVASGDVTMALLELHRRFDDLPTASQDLAARYFARPTEGGRDPEKFGYTASARPVDDCPGGEPAGGSRVCVTWASNAADPDAPPAADSDSDGVPDQVERTRAVVNEVWNRVVGRGGYLPPRPDAEGPGRALDIYLADVGYYGLYGYCSVDRGAPVRGAAAAYCVLDNDFARWDFPVHTPLENLQVTAAHEFFHAVQFAYDVGEDPWFMEGTAAWIEDELYDEVNDNRQYLAQSPLSDPNVPLDFTGASRHPYGNWIFWRFLGERYPRTRAADSGLPDIVRQVWTRARYASAARPGTYSMPALVRTLRARGTAFTRVFSAFGEANRHPAQGGHYEEGSAYRRAPLARSYVLSRSRGTTGWRRVTVSQLGTVSVAFRPGTGLRADGTRLRVRVDAPPRRTGAFARLTVHRADGRIVTRVLRLDRTGAGVGTAAFSTPEVRRVELTLTNASTRYACGRGTSLSCRGAALDARRRTELRAVVLR